MKYIKSIFIIGFFLLYLFQGRVQGQLSQGGMPIQIQKLKSIVSDDLIVMPAVDNEQMRQANALKQEQSGLKPFRFAHPFDVSLTPMNSGKWYSDGEVMVWQLRIRSAEAYSINLIFGKFNLPDNAKLFLIGADGNEIKGAYTSENNSEHGVLAVEPLAGEEILVQYEEPVGVAFKGELEISRISHDFIGIKAYDPRIPLGISGSCNLNVNCDEVRGAEAIRDAVCRLFVEGTDICTGTLVNNTNMDGTPYVLTAYHCINTVKAANATVFLFNFESPTCSTIIGDVSRSLSGSSMKANFDSLDFALVRLTNEVPKSYRPYFAGWNRRNQAPSNSMTIHHPLGDIKKAAIDNDNAVNSRYSSVYLANGCWKILRWDKGVTEEGSSGGPLFDQNKQLIGTLTGGSASCSLPTNDYFTKFALAWAYRKETTKQLKIWLDPTNSNVNTLGGMTLETVAEACKPVTNFKDNEPYAAIPILNGSTPKGYFSGTNVAGYTEFAEQYTFSTSCEVQGITLGVAKVATNPSFAQSWLNVSVYEGEDLPGTVPLHTQKFDIKKLLAEGMNYLQFQNPVKTSGNFFITYNIQELHAGDTLAMYMANRTNDATNSFFLKNSTGWVPYTSQNTARNGSALLTELVACQIDSPTKIDTLGEEPETLFFPNPLNGTSFLTVQTKETIILPESTVVYDLLGKQQNISISLNAPNELMLNFSNKRPGIYFVHVQVGGRTIVGKIAYIP